MLPLLYLSGQLIETFPLPINPEVPFFVGTLGEGPGLQGSVQPQHAKPACTLDHNTMERNGEVHKATSVALAPLQILAGSPQPENALRCRHPGPRWARAPTRRRSHDLPRHLPGMRLRGTGGLQERKGHHGLLGVWCCLCLSIQYRPKALLSQFCCSSCLCFVQLVYTLRRRVIS